MTKALIGLTGLAIGSVLAVAAECAHAQAAPTGPNQGQGHTGPAPPSATANSAPEDRALNAPVLHITSVEVIRSTHGPTMDIIRVRGVTSTSGWEEAELVPLTRGMPVDGILELVFVAHAPADAVEAQGFEPVEAIFPLEPNHPYKGVNVHSASESIVVTELPGYVEGKSVGDDCSKCVGKICRQGSVRPLGEDHGRDSSRGAASAHDARNQTVGGYPECGLEPQPVNVDIEPGRKDYDRCLGLSLFAAAQSSSRMYSRARTKGVVADMNPAAKRLIHIGDGQHHECDQKSSGKHHEGVHSWFCRAEHRG
jgi:hypothetical protein